MQQKGGDGKALLKRFSCGMVAVYVAKGNEQIHFENWAKILVSVESLFIYRRTVILKK